MVTPEAIEGYLRSKARLPPPAVDGMAPFPGRDRVLAIQRQSRAWRDTRLSMARWAIAMREEIHALSMQTLTPTRERLGPLNP